MVTREDGGGNTTVHPDFGVDIHATPPAASRVREDNNEDQDNVVARGMIDLWRATTLSNARTTTRIGTTSSRAGRSRLRRRQRGAK